MVKHTYPATLRLQFLRRNRPPRLCLEVVPIGHRNRIRALRVLRLDETSLCADVTQILRTIHVLAIVREIKKDVQIESGSYD